MDPVFDPERYVSLLTVQHMLSPTSRRGSVYRARAWLSDHGIPIIRLSRRLCVVERALVEAAQRGEPVQPKTDPTFDPAMWMPLAELTKLLTAGRKPNHRLTVKWCARSGVPIWRVNPRVALVPRAAVKDAMARQIVAPAPPRRTRRTPPYLRSKAQIASQAKAAKASSEYHAARREGRPFKKAPTLAGQRKIERLHEMADWHREARKAERAGLPVPAVPPVERAPTPPRFKSAPAPTDPKPLIDQPSTERKYIL